jgi:hypothetical protein
MPGMTSQQTVALIGLLFSLVSVVLSGWFSVRTAKMGHRLRIEAERRKDEETAIKAAEKVYEPLAQAAAELQSRIYNIVETGWVPLVKRYESHGDYAVTSTAFLFAHYFGWIEARREAVLSSSGKGRRDESVQQLIDGVTATLRRSESGDGFLFFAAEQRAIGELMVSWEFIPDTTTRLPHVDGYAAFVKRYRSDEDFRAWFAPVDAGMGKVSEGDNRRLIEIQRALVDLIRELDPSNRYTFGYQLEPIDLSEIGSVAPAEKQPRFPGRASSLPPQ